MFSKLRKIHKQGFTLIELLVVLTIISALVTIVYASFTESRTQARNNALRVEMKELKLALEQYRAQNGRYPLGADVEGDIGCYNDISSFRTVSKASNCGVFRPIISGLMPDYIDSIYNIKDSPNPDCDLVYTVADDGSWYHLMAEQCLSGIPSASKGVQAGDEMERCLQNCTLITCDQANANFYETLAVYSWGGQCQQPTSV